MKKSNDTNNTAKYQMILAMVIFGTIGLFRRWIPFPSGMIAASRGFLGMLFLMSWMAVRNKKWDRKGFRRGAVPLCISGGIMGMNWVLLFEAYRYTSVSVATLCYYMAPIFVILASPVLLGERLSQKKILGVAAAFCGMVLVSGVLKNGFTGGEDGKGILFGLAAAVLYSGVILMNKKMPKVEADTKTVVQLGSAGGVVLVYSLLTESYAGLGVSPVSVGMLLLVGFLHTGVAYALYFGSLTNLKAQTAAIYSYIDPIVAILLSAFLLKEGMDVTEVIGAVLILAAAFVCDKNE